MATMEPAPDPRPGATVFRNPREAGAR